MRMLAALKCVDWVVPFSEDTPARVIGRVLPDLLVSVPSPFLIVAPAI